MPSINSHPIDTLARLIGALPCPVIVDICAIEGFNAETSARAGGRGAEAPSTRDD